jgi:hypothetical protein
MAYTPTNWQTGDVVTAEKLNKLEGGVAALSNYDIVFTKADGSFTADGLSVEELYQKGLGNLNAALITDGESVRKPFAYSLYIEDGAKCVSFEFLKMGGGETTISHISTDGTAYIFDNDATFTYSNGHYVFTMSGSGGGNTPQ